MLEMESSAESAVDMIAPSTAAKMSTTTAWPNALCSCMWRSITPSTASESHALEFTRQMRRGRHADQHRDERGAQRHEGHHGQLRRSALAERAA
jgi:hypothetical protein